MDRCPVCNGVITPSDSVCPSCGFKLAGSTQEFRPISLDENGQPQPAKKRTPGTLTIVRGPSQIDTVYTLEDRVMSIGRSPRCDIFLNDMTVSREHATVQSLGERYAISDADSFNGVWINNKNIAQAVLQDGDLVQIGAFVLHYQQ